MKSAGILCAALLVSLSAIGSAHQGPPMQGRPMGGGDQGSSDPKVLANLDKQWKDVTIALLKHPKDKKVRENYVTVGVKYGHESMVSPLLTPHVKYPQALRIYKAVLKVDPTNPVAKPESDLIIKIYQQMGRKVPGG